MLTLILFLKRILNLFLALNRHVSWIRKLQKCVRIIAILCRRSCQHFRNVTFATQMHGDMTHLSPKNSAFSWWQMTILSLERAWGKITITWSSPFLLLSLANWQQADFQQRTSFHLSVSSWFMDVFLLDVLLFKTCLVFHDWNFILRCSSKLSLFLIGSIIYMTLQ